MDQCYTCWPGANGCQPVRDYDRLFVSEHGRVSGAHAMKVCSAPFGGSEWICF